MRVGLTGGIGSGKSVVARLFSSWGAAVIDADLLAREVMAPGTTGLREAQRRWPHAVDEQGSLDRAALARIVFADPNAREQLNRIVHPLVRARAAEIEAALPATALVVHVVPLLFEGDYWRTCDRTVLVVAPPAVRVARAAARDATTAERIEARMAAQIDPGRAAAMADFVIDNSGTLDDLAMHARAVFETLQHGDPQSTRR